MIEETVKDALLLKLITHTQLGMFILDSQFRYLYVNQTFTHTLGISENYVLARPFSIYELPYLLPELQEMISKIYDSLLNTGEFKGEMGFFTHSQHRMVLQVAIYSEVIEGELYYVGKFQDVKIKAKSELTAGVLSHDPSTKIPNRQFFLIQANDLLLTTVKELVLVRLNIDRYRLYQSTLTKEQCQKLLTDFVKRVTDLHLAGLKLFARFGGDDFALLFEVNDAQRVRQSLDKLMQLCELPYLIDEDVVYLRYSVGVSHYPKQGNQIDLLIENAEKAMHHVKLHGGGDVHWFDKRINVLSQDDLRLENELRQALDARQFSPFYQPKVRLKDGRIVGFEALVRWQHPTRGMVCPIDFLTGIIEHKLTFELFTQMAEQVCQDLQRWREMGFHDISVAINAEASELTHAGLLPFLRELLAKHTINRHCLHIEITEMTLMHHRQTVQDAIQAIKEMGILILLDDFGTGYASLNYLQQYEFDYLKIDKSFINHIKNNVVQQHIVETIISLAKRLGLKTVVEGVETKEQSELMQQLGCDFAQGYYYGKPMQYQQAIEFITAHLGHKNSDKKQPNKKQPHKNHSVTCE